MRAPEGLATISDAGSASKLSNADALKVCNAELSFPLVDQTPQRRCGHNSSVHIARAGLCGST